LFSGSLGRAKRRQGCPVEQLKDTHLLGVFADQAAASAGYALHRAFIDGGSVRATTKGHPLT